MPETAEKETRRSLNYQPLFPASCTDASTKAILLSEKSGEVATYALRALGVNFASRAARHLPFCDTRTDISLNAETSRGEASPRKEPSYFYQSPGII